MSSFCYGAMPKGGSSACFLTWSDYLIALKMSLIIIGIGLLILWIMEKNK